MAGPLYSSAGSLGPIPGGGTRFHRSQLRVHMPKTWHSQMYENRKKKKKTSCPSLLLVFIIAKVVYIYSENFAFINTNKKLLP